MALTATHEAEPTLSTDPPDPADLIRRASAGDDDAFRALVRHVLPRLRRWALARLGDPDDADEVVQRTLIRMHRGLDGFHGRSSLSTWLYRILANVSTDLRRSHAARLTRSREASSDGAESGADRDPVRDLHADHLAGLVREYLGSLPERQREVLTLVDHEGMRPVEVAHALDLDPVTVRAHLFKARRTVRERILERYPELEEGYEA